jgi:hypothetical protein
MSVISVRFQENWNVCTNSGENPQQIFTNISHVGAGLFYADIRTDNWFRRRVVLCGHLDGRTWRTHSLFRNCFRRRLKLFLITITLSFISRSAKQTCLFLSCVQNSIYLNTPDKITWTLLTFVFLGIMCSNSSFLSRPFFPLHIRLGINDYRLFHSMYPLLSERNCTFPWVSKAISATHFQCLLRVSSHSTCRRVLRTQE